MNDIATEERQKLGSRALRMARAKLLVKAFVAVVVVPTLAAAIYYGAIVTPQFESVAVLSIESGAGESDNATKKKGSAPPDQQAVRAHMLSRAMLDELIKNHDWVGHYSGGDVDWWSRLSSGAGSESTFDYYQDHVVITLTQDRTLMLRVFAFTPEKAHDIATAIKQASAKRLQERSATARKDVMEHPLAEVEVARERLLKTGGTDELKAEVARVRLASALRTLELAEIEAGRRKRTIWVVAPPSTPNEPSRPRGLWNILTVFVTTLALGAIALMLGGFVREHAKF